jgi:small nuclear ribonucleoprotein D3
MSRSLGIPVKLLHEAAGHVVTTELKTGEVYRGTMVECEDNWNCQLENITFTAKVRASYALLWLPWPRI